MTHRRACACDGGALPSGNSAMLINLLELHQRTGEMQYLDDAAATLQAISAHAAGQPVSAALGVLGLHRMLESHPERVDRSAKPHAAPAELVQLQLSTDALELRSGRSAELTVHLTIAPAYHINAHDSGDESLIGLDLELVDGEGLQMNVDYPAGQEYQHAIRIHRGSLTLPLRISQTGAVHGNPKIVLTYQACTDQICLAPGRIVLPVSIVAAPAGDE